MEYIEYYKLHNQYLRLLDIYVLKQDEVSDKYYVAKVFLDAIGKKCFTNQKFRDITGKWLKQGSTVELKHILNLIDYNDSNLTHFNAFCLMDSARLSYS